jgi:adenosylcobinamide-GDP ribazoletransferase
MKSLVLMIQFMTRYPIPLEIEFTARHFVQGMKWMPLVGLLAACRDCRFVLSDAWLARDVAALSPSSADNVTGGLHLDGIATPPTACSAIVPERMRKSCAIPPGCQWGDRPWGTILLSSSCCITLRMTARCGRALTPVLGRMARTWHSAGAPYAREERGIGDYVNQTGLAQAVAATLLSLVLVTGLLVLFGVQMTLIPLVALLLHLPAIALAVLFAAYLKWRLGGITGDTIGASIELAETLSFLVFLLVWKFLL